MRDRELYERILGLPEPWYVAEVTLDHEKEEVLIRVDLRGRIGLACPLCQKVMPGYDRQPRRWRHLDTCQYHTILEAEVPRGACAEHGVKQISVPWAEDRSRFTKLFERMAIDWLQESSQAAVARRLQMSWDEVHGIMERAVTRGLARREEEVPRYIGVDEKSFQKGHEYVTVVCDLEEAKVLYVGDDRKKESLDTYYQGLTEAQRQGIEAVAMDMWEPFVRSTLEHLPEAERKIVFDKFHVAQHLNKAVDQVRRAEHKALKAQGDETLKGTKYLWLRHPDHFEEDAWNDFAPLRASKLKTARAWAIKETGMELWDYVYEGSAKKFFERWYSWAIRSRLEPIKAKARMLKTHLSNILTHLKHRITNAVAEGINSKIQWIKHTARGFRNRENFRRAILFYCGGMNLYPH